MVYGKYDEHLLMGLTSENVAYTPNVWQAFHRKNDDENMAIQRMDAILILNLYGKKLWLLKTMMNQQILRIHWIQWRW